MPSPTLLKMRQDVVDIFQAGLSAVDPDTAIRNCVNKVNQTLRICGKTFDLNPVDNIIVIGAGKASGAMAATMEDILANRITEGHITVKYDHAVKLSRISITEAGHPIPDSNGVQGTARIHELATKAGPNDLVICLMSGGGSALMPAPCAELTLADKQTVSQNLLVCGASIHEINTIRKHLSQIKGGQLALAAHPARTVTLILSDVIGDDLDIIASGPTVPDPSTFQNCLEIIKKYQIEPKMPLPVMNYLSQGAQGLHEETPKPGHEIFTQTDNFIIANNQQALTAAQKKAQSLGYHTGMLTSSLTGEAKSAAKFHAAIIREIVQSGHPISPPACLLSGGETTVTLSGNGKGGRNQEFALAASLELELNQAVVLLSAGTDGTDGPTDAAGAVADNTTLERANVKELDARAFLANNDSYHFFKHLDDLFITGPTRTNVMDMHIFLVA